MSNKLDPLGRPIEYEIVGPLPDCEGDHGACYRLILEGNLLHAGWRIAPGWFRDLATRERGGWWFFSEADVLAFVRRVIEEANNGR